VINAARFRRPKMRQPSFPFGKDGLSERMVAASADAGASKLNPCGRSEEPATCD
jgi:hypothetical protein